ncbi:unnamed protein product [Camellia sinensis]
MFAAVMRIGFSSAMASNLTNQSRNVLSKKFMVNKEEALDNINLFSIITIISFVLLAPIAILMEGVKFSPSYVQFAASQGLNVRELCVRALLASFCFHTYEQGYMVGNGVADSKFDGNALVPFANGMGLISDGIFEEAEDACKGNYYNPNSLTC